MDGLRDIKELVTIEDYSLYFFVTLVVLISLLLIGLLIYGLKQWKRSATHSKKELAMRYLNALNFENPKETAYLISKWGIYLVEDMQREEFEMLLKTIEKYKYKKDVPSFCAEDIEKIALFLEKNHG